MRNVDRNGRVIGYAFDALSRQTTETWYDNLTDADAQRNVRKTYATTYDEAGRVAAIGDGDYDFAYTWSIFGNLTSTTQDLYGLTDDVVFSYAYDVLGRKTSVSAAVGSTDDYVNTYSYDKLGRITQIAQDGVSGGNAVAEKRVDFGYSDDGTRATISRFADLAGTKGVADTEQIFDELSRVTDIVHERATTEFADYDLAWDAAGRIGDFDFESLVGDDGASDYSYDDTNQLTGADYDFQTDETYTYDSNGNRTIIGYTTGDHNRLTSDGAYTYTYDNEGNVVTKTNISTSESVEYTWDHRNRLVKITFKTSGGTPTKIVEYAYDHGQRWVRKTLDTNADGTIEQSQVFVHDDGQIVLDFQKTGTSAASNSDLAHRYLWGNAVDQLLADETADDGFEEDVAWALTDHLNSVRDLVVYDPITGTVSVVKHVTFDAFGNVTSDSAPTVLTLFRYSARPFDVDSELQNNLHRWYDTATGRWMSTDPISFLGQDVNLYRYVGNSPVLRLDPLGLADALEPKDSGWEVKDPGFGVILAGPFAAVVISTAYEEKSWSLESTSSLGVWQVGWRYFCRDGLMYRNSIFKELGYKVYKRHRLETEIVLSFEAKAYDTLTQQGVEIGGAVLDFAGLFGPEGKVASVTAGMLSLLLDGYGALLTPEVYNALVAYYMNAKWLVKRKAEVEIGPATYGAFDIPLGPACFYRGPTGDDIFYSDEDLRAYASYHFPWEGVNYWHILQSFENIKPGKPIPTPPNWSTPPNQGY